VFEIGGAESRCCRGQKSLFAERVRLKSGPRKQKDITALENLARQRLFNLQGDDPSTVFDSVLQELDL
jgi:hypothetical protein